MAGRIGCLAFVLGAAFTVLADAPRSQAQAQQPEPPAAGSSASQPNSKKPFVFRGTVEKVNAAGGTVDVKNDNIPGWMAPMSMTYRLDTPAVLKTLKGGDRITATVYEGDTSRLYRVRVVTSPATQIRSALPPVSYVCPSPGEESFIDDAPGKCPKSGAELQAVRLDIAYKCLKTAYIREKPGTCPIDRADLVPVTASIFWLCKGDPDSEKHYLDPGTCRDGSPREKAFEVRPHGDHNPRHGGPSVFMSEDLYHHVEATIVAPTPTRPAAFRVYFYDEYTRPIKAAGISAHVALADKNGKATGSATPLVLSRIRDGNAMEARLPNAPVPSESAPVFLALRVKLKPSDKDWLTDHTFTSYSKEPVSRAPAPVRAIVTTGSAALTPAPNPVPVPPGPPASLDPLPETKQGLLAELQKNMDSVTKQWQEGSLDGLWYPALRVKDAVLKLQQDHGHDIPEDKQPELTSAVQRTTQSAWQIDSAGDLGNKEKIAVLYEVFHTAVGDILGLYGAGH
jgi:Cu/Ag efflux protein CusF